MKIIILLLSICALLTGCDFSIPLVEQPTLELDKELAGAWIQTSPEEPPNELQIFPFNHNEYLIVFPSNRPDPMLAKACLLPQASGNWIQLNWLGTVQGKRPENDKTFQYASYTREGKTLRIRLLNPKVFPSRDPTADALKEVILQNEASPDPLRPEMIFQKKP